MTTKVLTIWQPYATLLMAGVKRFETRSWYTQYRGPLVIHAASKADRSVQNDICRVMDLVLRHASSLRLNEQSLQELLADMSSPTAFGKAIGVVDLVSCTEMLDGGSVFENKVGTFGNGRFGWECSRPRWFPEPIAAKGKQQLWRATPEIETAVQDIERKADV